MDAVWSGMRYGEVTQRFRVSNSTILRWVRRLQERLLQRFATKPDVTLREVLAELHDCGIEVGYFALWHIVRRAELRFRKRPSMRASRIALPSRGAAVGGGGGCNG